jgi:TRAP-type mannitol/chloroaromatic compound transport system permease large subunit
MKILVPFGAVLVLVLFDIPIAIALGVVAVVALVATQGVDMLPNVAITMYNGATSFPLIAIPLFILSGAIMNASGISRRLIAFASALLGWIGYSILDVLATDYLISIPTVSVAWTQSVIPISCVLFIVAELLNLPDAIRVARGRAGVERSDLAEGLQ